jgi:hypothetical protein
MWREHAAGGQWHTYAITSHTRPPKNARTLVSKMPEGQQGKKNRAETVVTATMLTRLFVAIASTGATRDGGALGRAECRLALDGIRFAARISRK